METLLTALVFLTLIGFLFKWIARYRDFGIRLNEQNEFKFLLGWIIFGFLTRLDYSTLWGCVIDFEPFYEPRNVLFSAISFGLIYYAFKADSLQIKKIFCLTELTYWIARLIVFQGGYAVGYGSASPGILIVIYDLVAVGLRLLVLSRLLQVNNFRFLKIGIFAIIVLTIKILFFTTPGQMIYEDYRAFQAAQVIRKELVGNWEGEVKIDDGGRISKEEVSIEIDSTYIYFDGIEGLEHKYHLVLEHNEYGHLSKDGMHYHSNVMIQNQTRNTLIMVIYGVSETFEFSLKKETY